MDSCSQYVQMTDEEIASNKYVGIEKGKMLQESNQIFKRILGNLEEVCVHRRGSSFKSHLLIKNNMQKLSFCKEYPDKMLIQYCYYIKKNLCNV